MRRVTIAVIGNGKTTRANVDALIADMADSVDHLELALVYDAEKSDGQVWAEQWALSNSIHVGDYGDNSYDLLILEHNPADLRFFILWDDADIECQTASSWAQEHGIPAFDLTDGLLSINLIKTPIAAPQPVEIPEIEAQVSDEPIEPQLSSKTPEEEALIKVAKSVMDSLEAAVLSEADDEEDDFEELEDEDYEFLDDAEELGILVSEAIKSAARVFAREFAAEFKKHVNE